MRDALFFVMIKGEGNGKYGNYVHTTDGKGILRLRRFKNWKLFFT